MAETGASWLTVDARGKALVVSIKLAEVYDAQLCIEIEQFLATVLAKVAQPQLVIDLSAIGGVGSRFFGLLIVVRKAAKSKGGRVALAGLTEKVAQSFRIAGLNKTLRAYATVDEALQQVGQ